MDQDDYLYVPDHSIPGISADFLNSISGWLEMTSDSIVNTFDPIDLSQQSIMAKKGIPMLCEDAPSQLPTLYICPATNVLGRIPLIPCYMDGQTHATIPHRFSRVNLGGAIADTRPDNGTGSRLYELNHWMWRYGRSLPRTMSVADSEKIRHKRMLVSRTKGAETKRRRREARDGEQT